GARESGPRSERRRTSRRIRARMGARIPTIAPDRPRKARSELSRPRLGGARSEQDGRCRLAVRALRSGRMSAIPKLVVCDFPAKTNIEGWSSFSPFVLEVDRALVLAKLPFSRHHVNMFK